MDERLKQLLAEGRELYEKRDFRAAEPILEQVATAGTKFADVFDMLGVIAHQRGDVIAAEERFRRAVAINPNYTEALLNLAITLNDRRKYDEAREVFERLSRKTPRGDLDIEPFARGKLANLHADLAEAYGDLGMPYEAIEQLEKSVKLCPGFADLRTRLGVLYRDLGRLEDAKAELTAAVHANPKYARAHVLLGSTLLALGDKEAARGSWNEALVIEPDNPRAASFLKMLDEEVAASRNGA
jgi:tetratricopeptide (TPR) repeat protein